MNIVTHIFKKDLRHNRVLLVVWLVLLAVQYALMGVNVIPGNEAMQSLFEIMYKNMPALLILVMIVMVPLLVHAEPLVGTTAFWFTRPISRANLLKSKTLFVLLVLTLPPLVGETIVLATNGATAHDLLLAAPEIVMEDLVIVLCVGVFAVVTPNFGRFALTGAVTWVSLMLLGFVISWTISVMRTKDILTYQSDYNASLQHSRSVLSLLLTILAGGAVAAHQYLTRNTFRTIASAFLGLVLVIAMASYWPVDMFKRKPLPASAPGFDSSTVQVSFTGEAAVPHQPNMADEGPPYKIIQSQIRIEGVPPGYMVTAQSVQSAVTGSSGNALKVRPYRPNPIHDTYAAAALEAALGGATIINASHDDRKLNERYDSFFSLHSDTYQQYFGGPVKVSAKVDFVASKYVVTGELPLAPGAQSKHRRDRIVIVDVLKKMNAVDIELRETHFNFMLDPGDDDGVIQDGPRVLYLLLNKKQGEAVKEWGSSRLLWGGMYTSWMVNRTMVLSFGPQENDPAQPDLSPEWLADATLVRLELTPVAEFTKEFSDDHFVIQGTHSR